MAASIADFNNDDWLSSGLVHDTSAHALIVRLRAKQSIRITEVQGSTTDLEAFGLSMPDGFRKMLFGEGVHIPDAMKSDIEHMNRLNFRWGCDMPLKAGSTAEIRIPASGAGKERVALSLTYEYPKLFGLLRGKHGFYARMLPS